MAEQEDPPVNVNKEITFPREVSFYFAHDQIKLNDGTHSCTQPHFGAFVDGKKLPLIAFHEDTWQNDKEAFQRLNNGLDDPILRHFLQVILILRIQKNEAFQCLGEGILHLRKSHFIDGRWLNQFLRAKNVLEACPLQVTFVTAEEPGVA